MFDVSARLAEGRAAVDEAQTYVSASRLRGYAHPDLTRYSEQVLDWYSALDGLRLDALDADCQSLRAAAARAASALNDIRGTVVGLPAGWRGQGASRVTDYLAGHCDTAQRLVDALELAQSGYGRLRDELWSVVDRQVSVTLAMAEQGRSEWAEAARAVLAGDAGRGDAGDVVDSQVKPFVDRVIRGEWLVSMQSVADDVEAAYRAAIARAGALGGLVFEVPGGSLSWNAAPRAPVAAPVPASVVPAPPPAVARDALDTLAPGVPQPSAVPAAAVPAPAVPTAAVPAPAMPAFGAGMPSPGWPALPEFGAPGLGALPHSASQPFDAPALDIPRLGGLGEDSPPEEPRSLAEPGEAEFVDPAVEDTTAEDPPPHADLAVPSDKTEPLAEATDAAPVVPDCPPPTSDAEPVPPTPAAEPGPPMPVTEPAPPAPTAPTPAVEPATPCEIAADELPQVGE